MDMAEQTYRRPIQSNEELEVYRIAFTLAQHLFEISKSFPREETYSLTDQIRKSSRSVCANIAEAWRKRRYEAAFVSKLNDAEGEAAETQTWLKFSAGCGYLPEKVAEELWQEYNRVIGKIVVMIDNPDPWILSKQRDRSSVR